MQLQVSSILTKIQTRRPDHQRSDTGLHPSMHREDSFLLSRLQKTFMCTLKRAVRTRCPLTFTQPSSACGHYKDLISFLPFQGLFFPLLLLFLPFLLAALLTHLTSTPSFALHVILIKVLFEIAPLQGHSSLTFSPHFHWPPFPI